MRGRHTVGPAQSGETKEKVGMSSEKKQKEKMFSGIYTPSVTIIDQSGNIDYESMTKHVNNLIDAGINGILFFGSIGEFFSFSPTEKADFLRYISAETAGRVKVLTGIGAAGMKEVLDNASAAEKAGVDGVVCLPPFYFGHSAGRAHDFYGCLCSHTNLPIMLYNFPERTGADLTPELVAELAAKHKNIVGIKDTVDSQSHARRIVSLVKQVRPDFSVLSGFDEYYLGNRICGGDGVLSGLTNIIPEVFVRMHRAYNQGNYAVCQNALAEIMRVASLYEIGDLFISGIKEGVRVRGISCSSAMRAPATELTEKEKAEVAAVLAPYL